MSQISHAPHRAHLPWSTQAPGHAAEVRRAITARRHDTPVDTEVAPMMAALLHRLDHVEGPTSPPALAAPRAPDPAAPPSPERTLRSMSTASSKLRAQLAHPVADDPQSTSAHQQLTRMLGVVEEHVQRTHEVLTRAAAPPL